MDDFKPNNSPPVAPQEPHHDNTVTQCDTDVETISGTVTVAAYKHYLTKFKADAANLKNGNGTRRQVCSRIKDALTGMIQHFEATGEKDRYHLKEYLEQFVNTIHRPIMDEYPTDEVKNMPIGIYKPELDRLYELVK